MNLPKLKKQTVLLSIPSNNDKLSFIGLSYGELQKIGNSLSANSTESKAQIKLYIDILERHLSDIKHTKYNFGSLYISDIRYMVSGIISQSNSDIEQTKELTLSHFNDSCDGSLVQSLELGKLPVSDKKIVKSKLIDISAGKLELEIPTVEMLMDLDINSMTEDEIRALYLKSIIIGDEVYSLERCSLEEKMAWIDDELSPGDIKKMGPFLKESIKYMVDTEYKISWTCGKCRKTDTTASVSEKAKKEEIKIKK